MEELKAPTLARPLDKNALGNDAATMRNLLGMLNNPEITGAVVPKDEKYDGPAGTDGVTLPPESLPVETAQPPKPEPPPPAATPAPAPAPASNIGFRLLFTGRGARETATAIGAALISLSDPIFDLARAFFPPEKLEAGNPGAPEFLATLKAWGSGEISAKYPITPARACFITMIRSLSAAGHLPAGPDWSNFGSDGFWIDSVVAQSKTVPGDTRVVISGVESKIEFDYFRTLGFSHWHCMKRPQVAPAGTPDLNASLDHSVTQQISQQKTGPKLRAIWADVTAPASARLWTMSDFVSTAGQYKPATTPAQYE